MTKSKNIHIVLLNDGWIVQKESNYRPISVHSTQRDAVEVGREIARTQQSQLVIHGRDGRVRERNSYSLDRPAPRPPKVLLPQKRASASKKAIMEAVLAVMRESKDNAKSRGRTVNAMK